MRVTVYDKNPGKGIGQWFLSLSWAIGCFLQKLFGLVDEYYGAESWDDVIEWISRHDAKFESFQYWGHGSPGTAWLAETQLPTARFEAAILSKLTPSSVVWWRVCSSFQGDAGQVFAIHMSRNLNCTVAGHTRIIGLLQGGLHTLKPLANPSWSVNEGELPPSFFTSLGLVGGNNTIFCLTTKIPEGW